MDIVDVLRAHGGVARWSQLRGRVSRRALARCVAAGVVEKRGHGTYALPPVDRRALASRQRGVLSHTSAAQEWGLAVIRPEQEHVTVPWKARRTRVPDEVRLHYRDLPDTDVVDGVTSRERTVLDCAADMPLREALAVGDSALRRGLVSHADLVARARRWRGRRAGRIRTVVAQLDARAENAFESATRAILLGAGITGFRPQLVVAGRGVWLGRVDLADPERRLIIECDSFTWHGGPRAFERDCRRYCEFVAHGWQVLRLAWEQVMFEADWVVAVVRATIEGGTGISPLAPPLAASIA